MRLTNKLLPYRTKNMGIITLNNPNALHALTQDMVDGLDDIFQEWKITDGTSSSSSSCLRAILFKSTPAKRPAFCAGGDVKSVYKEGLTVNGKPEDFFRHEYKVNHAIATTTIPVISLWDGVVMGGGAGISVHGKYRVATENSLFAMPECAIGLFPDVGSMWWMTRLLESPVAKYLALTGQRILPEDLLYTGLATHYVPSDRLEKLELALANATESKYDDQREEDAVAKVLESFHKTISTRDCHLDIHKQTIETTFNAESVEEIFANLGQENSEFAQSTLKTLQKLSPTSLKLTLEGLKRGAACNSIGEDLQMEYRMAKACVRPGADFYEGIRATLIDKDHGPKWNPATLEDVTKDMIEKYFLPSENYEWPIPTSVSKL
jgi:3-hydroxyisobutyryl-CoA hydrolase